MVRDIAGLHVAAQLHPVLLPSFRASWSTQLSGPARVRESPVPRAWELQNLADHSGGGPAKVRSCQ